MSHQSLRETPPVIGEVKNGKKVHMSGNKWRPKGLDHWRVVWRKKDNNNFKKIEKVHDQIGESPKQVPIRFLTDSPTENFPLFRGAFKGGEFACGAPYSGYSEDDYMTCWATEAGRPITDEDKVEFRDDGSAFIVDDNGNEVDLHEEEFVKATRRFRGREFPVDPYDHPCSEFCPLHQMDNKKDGSCNLSGTLYFHLRGPIDEKYHRGLFVYRANGINAMRYLKSSIKMIQKKTRGILSGLPLILRFHQENTRDQDGNTRKVPAPMIEMGCEEDKFLDLAAQELVRRREYEEFRTGEKAGDFDAIKKEDILRDMHSRQDFQMHREPPSVSEEEEEAPELSEKLEEAFEEAGYSKRKRQMVCEEHDHDEEKILDHIERDTERDPDPLAEIDDGLGDL